MQIKSEQYTNRIRTGANSFSYLPPGTVFEVSDEKGREKIASGRAELAIDAEEDPAEVPVLVPSSEQTNQGGGGEGVGQEPTTASPTESGQQQAEDLERLQEAMLNLDSDVAEKFLKDGRPTVEAVSKAMGRDVSAAERDAAWTDLQDE